MSNRILVIDPNTAVQAITSLALSHLEAEVETLSEGEGAQEFIGSFAPDVILCARQMPNIDALELARWFKDQTDNSAARFVLLASNEMTEEETEEAKVAGVDEILF